MSPSYEQTNKISKIELVNRIDCTIKKTTATITSKQFAAALDLTHNAVIKLAEKYAAEIEKSGGKVGFEIRPSPSGQAEKIATLDEDASFSLLTLTKNNAKTVAAKMALVRAFRDARHAIEARQTTYIPNHWQAQDAIKQVIERAREHGSTTPEAVFYANYARLVDSVCGIGTHQRDRLTPDQQLRLSHAYRVLEASTIEALNSGADHKEAYQRARQRLQDAARYLN